MIDQTKCNCGRQIRYSHIVDGEEMWSCNKHTVCLTYDDLYRQHAALKNSYKMLLDAALDVTTFREGTEHYNDAAREIEFHVKELEGET